MKNKKKIVKRKKREVKDLRLVDCMPLSSYTVTGLPKNWTYEGVEENLATFTYLD